MPLRGRDAGARRRDPRRRLRGERARGSYAGVPRPPERPWNRVGAEVNETLEVEMPPKEGPEDREDFKGLADE